MGGCRRGTRRVSTPVCRSFHRTEYLSSRPGLMCPGHHHRRSRNRYRSTTAGTAARVQPCCFLRSQHRGDHSSFQSPQRPSKIHTCLDLSLSLKFEHTLETPPSHQSSSATRSSPHPDTPLRAPASYGWDCTHYGLDHSLRTLRVAPLASDFSGEAPLSREFGPHLRLKVAPHPSTPGR